MSNRIDRVRAVMAAPEDIDVPEDLRAEAGAISHDEADAPLGDEDIAYPGDDAMPPHPPEDGEDVPERECAAFALNDFGNGRRFVTHFGDETRWVPTLGWHLRCSTHWAHDKYALDVRDKAQQLGELIAREIPYLTLEDWQMAAIGKESELRGQLRSLESTVGEDGKRTSETEAEIAEVAKKLKVIADLKKTMSDKRKAHRNFARSSGNTGKIDAAMKEAAPHIALRHEELDANPLQVNCLSGLLEFEVITLHDPYSRVASVRLLPHDRSQLVSKVMPVRYVPDAKCPLFLKFLTRIMPAEDMRRFLQRWFGLSMTGIPIQALAFFYGAGANGKSVLVELIAKILDGYAADIRIETLTGKTTGNGAAATPDLVVLIGARMARASEPREGEPLQDALIKSITSGEPIMVRPNYGDFFRLYPVFKLTMSGNHRPDIRSTDDGIWRRMKLVPFDVQIPEAERDPHLPDKLWEEREGILQWMIAGLIDYLEGGLQEPDAVRNATQEYRDDSDPVGTFINSCCMVTGEEKDRIPSRDLVQAFNYWLDCKGEGTWTERRVASRIKDKAGRWKSSVTGRTFMAVKSSGIMTYSGIQFEREFGERFRNAPRTQEGKPMAGRVAGYDV